jgi:penicillin-binding protein 1C
MAPPPAGANAAPRVRIRQPAPGLMLALDPRLPRAAQRLRFSLAPAVDVARVDWFVNGARVAHSAGRDWLWPLERGAHTVRAEVYRADGGPGQRTPAVRFQVQ